MFTASGLSVCDHTNYNLPVCLVQVPSYTRPLKLLFTQVLCTQMTQVPCPWVRMLTQPPGIDLTLFFVSCPAWAESALTMHVLTACR